MAEIREVGVFRGDSELARQPLELLRLPGGRIGAKWGGLVFPLRDSDSIDVTDAGVPPGQCSPIDEQALQWRISTVKGGTGAYLFLNGSAKVCGRVVEDLKNAGFSVLRSGPNLSGSTEDWFIRIEKIAEGDNSRLGELLKETGRVESVDDDTSARERLLLNALVTAQAATAGLRQELDRLRDYANDLPDRKYEERILRESLNELSRRLAEAQAESDALRLRAEAGMRATHKPNRLEVELSTAATQLLPRIELIAGSMNFIAVELPSRATLWKALTELDRQDRGQPAGWKSLAGHTGWWERHFSTGQDNQGRIYARLNGHTARWQVLVSHKQDQAQDLRRISRM
jgi:hypothetical protein